MFFEIVNGLLYVNSIYNTYKSGQEFYKKYRVPINWTYTYMKRKYYKY